MQDNTQRAEQPKASPLTQAQHRYLTRAIDVFSVVHVNQHATTLGPYTTLFFDDGADCSFELSSCMNINCIMSDLRDRLVQDNLPRAIVMFFPGLSDARKSSTHDGTVYIEVRGHAPGVVLSAHVSSIQQASMQGSSGVELTKSPDGITIPPDLLDRVVNAVRKDLDPQSALVAPSEVSPVLSGFECSCTIGVRN